MKITDLFSRIQKGGSGADAGKAARLIQPVQPVGHVGKLTLVPGQLLQGEVVGEDANGQLLLKLAGEIIAARTAVKLEAGQQFWFEVKEAGDSPLLDLASRKGAVQELLKDIMATRPLLVKAQASPSSSASSPLHAQTASGPGAGPAATPPFRQASAAVSAELASAPAGQPASTLAGPPAAVIAADGSLPPEAARLVRALVRYVNQPVSGTADQRDTGISQPPPLIKTIVSLIREGQIPASLQKVEAFQGVVQTKASLVAAVPREGQGQGVVAPGGELPASPGPAAPEGTQPQVAAVSGSPSSPAPAVLATDTIKILNSLVAVAGIKAPSNGDAGPLQPVANPDQNLAEILTLVARQDKIPASLQKLAPLRMLMASSVESSALKAEEGLQAVSAESKEAAEQGLSAARAVLPLQFAAAQQGGESLPAQLRLLASLMGMGSRNVDMEAWKEIEGILGRLSEAEMPAAARKLASFFDAHSRVNSEVAPQGQSDFYIMPSVFSAQAGWGEWLWSRERSPADNDSGGQENLAFFLEMSNLGALTIQVILKEKKLRGQILMSDKKGCGLVASLLPGLLERLQAFGYDVVDFPCSCQPLNVMQELKESLHARAGSGSVSLLDVQA